MFIFNRNATPTSTTAHTAQRTKIARGSQRSQTSNIMLLTNYIRPVDKKRPENKSCISIHSKQFNRIMEYLHYITLNKGILKSNSSIQKMPQESIRGDESRAKLQAQVFCEKQAQTHTLIYALVISRKAVSQGLSK